MSTKKIKLHNIALQGADVFNIRFHPGEQLWGVPSSPFRKYWTPAIGPASVRLYEVLSELTQNGPVEVTTSELAKRVGIKDNRVRGALARIGGVFSGEVVRPEDGSPVQISLPAGVCPPSHKVRRSCYPEVLHEEFDAYLNVVGVTLVESGLGSPSMGAGLDV